MEGLAAGLPGPAGAREGADPGAPVWPGQHDPEFGEYLTLVSDVFAGRFDTYALAVPHRKPLKRQQGKLEYLTQTEPLTPQVLGEHLDGDRAIGIYPLVEGYVRWIAIDYDAPKRVDPGTGERIIPEDPFPDAWAEAVRQAEAFETAGLFCYLERSRSGKGVHLWLFFDEFISAIEGLRALKPLLVDAESYDRMYPVQTQVKDGGWGNLIALPFHAAYLRQGNAAFLNRETLEPIDPLEFLRSVQFNNRYVIEELAERAPKDLALNTVGRKALPVLDGDVGEAGEARFVDPNFEGRPPQPITGFLKLISQFGCSFMRHCVTNAKTISQTEWWVAIGQTTCFRNGRDAAHLLSMLDRDRYDATEVDEVYNRISGEVPHGCAWIHANFPKLGCSGCPMKAPYHKAKLPILELARETNSPLAKQDWNSALARIRRRNAKIEQTGRKWRTAGLDAFTRIRRAEFIVIGARPSIGKTAFLVDAAVNLAEDGTPVLIFSGETGESSLQDRFIARVARVNSKLLRGELDRDMTPDELRRVEEAAAHLATLPIYINYAATRADQILDLVESTVLRERIPLDQEYVVFQDYMQFGNTMDSKGGDSPYARISKVSTEFKFVGKILNNAFATFSQLSRHREKEQQDPDQRPQLSDFRESGQIEQDADVAMILSGERMPGEKAPRFLDILKDKEGEAGHRIELLLHQAHCYFEPLRRGAEAAPRDLFPEQSTILDEV